MWKTATSTGITGKSNHTLLSADPNADVSVASLASMIAASMSSKKVLQNEKDGELVFDKENEIQLASKDRLRRDGRMKYHKALRNKLPILSLRDIRRFRMPFHEALYEELKEDGFLQTAAYLHSLVMLDDEIRNLAGPESIEWRRPRLLDQMDFLLKLRVALVEAEIAQRKDQAEVECTAYLQLATFFMRQELNWWWLAEQLMLQAVEAGKRHRMDGGRHQALARYIYGAFLLKQLREVEDACLQLRVCRDLAAGRDWTFPQELDVGSGTLFTMTTVLLHQATMALVREARLTEPKKALRLAKTAAARVRRVGLPVEEAEALLELATCHLEAGDPRKALTVLSHYWALDDNPRRLCDAHLVSAICFQELGKSQDIYSQLEIYLHLAEINCLKDLEADGHLYLGEYHLSENHNVEAAAHLVTAFTMYYRTGQLEQMEQTRSLAGVAAAQEHYPRLSELIIDSKKDRLNLVLFSRWKENRTPFWMEYSVFGSKYDIQSIGEASLLSIGRVSKAKELSDTDVQSISMKEMLSNMSIQSMIKGMDNTQDNQHE